MGRLEEMERQIEELKKAKNALLNKTAECMQVNDKVKVEFYNNVVPLLRTAVEEKIKNGTWIVNVQDVAASVLKKALTSAFGNDAWENLEKV